MINNNPWLNHKKSWVMPEIQGAQIVMGNLIRNIRQKNNLISGIS